MATPLLVCAALIEAAPQLQTAKHDSSTQQSTSAEQKQQATSRRVASQVNCVHWFRQQHNQTMHMDLQQPNCNMHHLVPKEG